MSEFLDKLESKIDAIDEKERKKIIKKYQRIIEEKIKDGMEEKEAIQSLGDINDIAKDICEDYHVNLVNRKRTFKEVLNDGIEESAKFLAETCQDVITYSKAATKDNFLISFFEIALKIVILVLLFMLFKIPFIILQSGLEFTFELLFFPFNVVLTEIFEYIISILYGAVCIATSIYIFKGYYINNNEESKEEVKEDESLKEEKKEITKKGINYFYCSITINSFKYNLFRAYYFSNIFSI